MEDIGAKLSQPGFDVGAAGSQDLLFSSAFPSLKEEKTGLFTGTNDGTDQVIFEHNLTYHPLFLVQVNKGSGGEMDTSNLWYIDDNKLYFRNSTVYKYRWTIYRLPLYEAFQSDDTQQQATVPGGFNHDFGMKFTKEGKDLKSTDLRDFTLHSRGRTPLIHSVSVKDWTVTTTEHTAYHKLPYIPLAFGFTTGGAAFPPKGTSYPVFPNPQASPGIARGADFITIGSDGATSLKTSIIILKDPFITTDVVRVKY